MNKTNSNARRLIRDCLHGQKVRILVNCILNAIVSVAYIAFALLSKQLIDIAVGQATGRFVPYGLLMGGTVLLQLICYVVSSHNTTVAAGKMSVYLQKRLLAELMQKKYSQICTYHSGDLLQRFTADSETVVSNITSLVPSAVATISKLIAGSVALLFLDWRLASALILIGVIVPSLVRLLANRYKRYHKDLQASGGKIKAFLQEHFRNLPVIKSFASKEPMNRKFDRLLSENYRKKMKRNWLTIATGGGFYLFFTAGYFLVLIWGATGIQRSLVTYGSLLAFLQIIAQMRGPMQSISGIMPQYYTMIASAERLCELEQVEDELLPVSDEMLDAMRDVFESITARDLSFSYNETPVLTNCNFSIPRGSVAVISGVSGKGKTTLFRLLLGYYEPQSGTLRLSNTYEINASTRRLFAYVPQDSMILTGTIRENLSLCQTGLTDERIYEALHTAQLDDFLASLPNGLDTLIGENGLGISQGQAQRLAIARALLCDAPILLLDEATDALDQKTEQALLLALRDLPDTTVLLVTHHTVDDSICTCRLQLENGTITQKNPT